MNSVKMPPPTAKTTLRPMLMSSNEFSWRKVAPLSNPSRRSWALERTRVFSTCSICQTPSRRSRKTTSSAMWTSYEPSGCSTNLEGRGLLVRRGAAGGVGRGRGRGRLPGPLGELLVDGGEPLGARRRGEVRHLGGEAATLGDQARDDGGDEPADGPERDRVHEEDGRPARHAQPLHPLDRREEHVGDHQRQHEGQEDLARRDDHRRHRRGADREEDAARAGIQRGLQWGNIGLRRRPGFGAACGPVVNDAVAHRSAPGRSAK